MSCHSERSEESLEMLRFTQHDRHFVILKKRSEVKNLNFFTSIYMIAKMALPTTTAYLSFSKNATCCHSEHSEESLFLREI